MKKLNLGCGNDIRSGWVNADAFSPTADLRLDFDNGRDWRKLKKNSFEEVLMSHSIEHSANPIKVLQKIYAVCKPNALVCIIAPHYSQQRSDGNLFHYRTGLGTHSFDPFTDSHQRHYNAPSLFRVENIALRYKGFWKFLLEPLANRFKVTYELWLSRFFPLEEIEFNLRVIKPKKETKK